MCALRRVSRVVLSLKLSLLVLELAALAAARVEPCASLDSEDDSLARVVVERDGGRAVVLPRLCRFALTSGFDDRFGPFDAVGLTLGWLSAIHGHAHCLPVLMCAIIPLETPNRDAIIVYGTRSVSSPRISATSAAVNFDVRLLRARSA